MKRGHHWSGLNLSVVLTALMLAATPAATRASHIGEELLADQQTVAANNDLIGALRQYEQATQAQRTAALDRVVAAAARRQGRLATLVASHPQLALTRVLPPGLKARLPAQAQAWVERDVNAAGVVAVSVLDDFARGRVSHRFELVDAAGQRFDLSVTNAALTDMLKLANKNTRFPAVQVGRKLLVQDRHRIQLLANGAAGSAADTTMATTAAVQGEQSTLVIMANFSDKPLSCTAADLQTRLFAAGTPSVNEGYKQSSGGTVSLSGQVVGPFPINYTSTGGCDYNGWASAASAAAKAAGFDPAGYKRVSYALPPNGTCGWSGLATLGGTSPTPSWVLACGSTGVFSHEIGHNLKFHHASTPTSEYGDSSDPMGAAMLVQFNAANRVMAGWVAGAQLRDVAAAGTYHIDALENTSSTNALVLRFPKPDSGETYYVSLRQAIGLDAGLPTGYLGAISVHRATGTMPAQTFRVANLATGQSWTDSTNGITVVHGGLTPTGASVNVTLGSAPVCNRQAPAVSVSPASQSASPGATLTYNISVTNNNSMACGSSLINFSQSLPAGFTGTFNPSSLTLSAGAAGSLTWGVNSASAAADGTYTLTASAVESAQPQATQSHASYTVLAPIVPPPPPPPPPDTTAPSLIVTSPVIGAVLSGRTAALAASAADASGIASVTFYLDDRLLSTVSASPYGTVLNLRKVTAGAHVIRVTATDKAGNQTHRSVSVTVTK